MCTNKPLIMFEKMSDEINISICNQVILFPMLGLIAN